jgi:hypothetical protein
MRHKRVTTREVKFARMVKTETKLHNVGLYKFGILVPKSEDAIDAANGNKKWQRSMDGESVKSTSTTLRDLGKGDLHLQDHNKIRVHFVYDVKL